MTYSEGAESVEKWMIDMEACVKKELELKDTLPEKRAQLQQHKVIHVIELMSNIRVRKIYLSSVNSQK